MLVWIPINISGNFFMTSTNMKKKQKKNLIQSEVTFLPATTTRIKQSTVLDDKIAKFEDANNIDLVAANADDDRISTTITQIGMSTLFSCLADTDDDSDNEGDAMDNEDDDYIPPIPTKNLRMILTILKSSYTTSESDDDIDLIFSMMGENND